MQSHRRLFLEHCAQTSPKPIGLEIVKAKGLYLTDIHKKRYMDLISGISVSALGHGHRKWYARCRNRPKPICI